MRWWLDFKVNHMEKLCWRSLRIEAGGDIAVKCEHLNPNRCLSQLWFSPHPIHQAQAEHRRCEPREQQVSVPRFQVW